jgi:hypothetical protein
MIDPQQALDLMAAERRLFPDPDASRLYKKREPTGYRGLSMNQSALQVGLFKEVKFAISRSARFHRGETKR